MTPARTYSSACPQGNESASSPCVFCVCFSVEGDAPVGEVGVSVDPSYSCVPVSHSAGLGSQRLDSLGSQHLDSLGSQRLDSFGSQRLDSLGPQALDSQLYGHIFLPGHQRPRRPKLQHSQSILRKQAEEEAIKRSRSLSESYELSSDLQDKQVT